MSPLGAIALLFSLAAIAAGLPVAAEAAQGHVTVFFGTCETRTDRDVIAALSPIPRNDSCQNGRYSYGLQSVYDFKTACTEDGAGQVLLFEHGTDCTVPINTRDGCADEIHNYRGGLGNMYHIFSCISKPPNDERVPTTTSAPSIATTTITTAAAAITLKPTTTPKPTAAMTSMPTTTLKPTPTPTTLGTSEGKITPGYFDAAAVCSTQASTDVNACNSKIRQCANNANIKMKWTGTGCKTASGFRYNDGGCQCDGYCGYNCKLACDNDSQCSWDRANKVCMVKATGLVGVPIRYCQ